jgi:hypothetical protein
MNRIWLGKAVLVSIGTGVGGTSAQESGATETATAPAARFGAPVLIRAGEAPMGAKRLYPSPALQDMNGDGRADVVLGDLWGRLTVALRRAADGPAAFGPDEPLLARDGQRLDFHNW